jgi:hypothetical protein
LERDRSDPHNLDANGNGQACEEAGLAPGGGGSGAGGGVIGEPTTVEPSTAEPTTVALTSAEPTTVTAAASEATTTAFGATALPATSGLSPIAAVVPMTALLVGAGILSIFVLRRGR